MMVETEAEFVKSSQSNSTIYNVVVIRSNQL